MNKMKKITCAFFLVFVFGSSLLQFLPDQTFSDQENRVLAQLPEVSIDKLASGKFADEMEEYASDQFPLRNGWVLIHNLYERLLMKLETGGSYVLFDRLIQQFQMENEQNIQKNINKITFFHDI